jgi:hypothetical protein
MLSICRLINLGPLGQLYVERADKPNPSAWKWAETWLSRGERFVCLGRFQFIYCPRRFLQWQPIAAE